MTRKASQGRRRKNGKRVAATVEVQTPHEATPYLERANPPRKRPGHLFFAILLWVLVIVGLVYLAFA